MTPTHYRWARGRLGLTHAGMGLLIGKSARTSIRYEQGNDEIPSGIEHLIELMTCNPGDLFGARKRILIARAPHMAAMVRRRISTHFTT
jgi:hypothetical protein